MKPALRPSYLVRAPWVVAYWHDSRFVLDNYATGVRILAEPLTTEVLEFFGHPRTIEAAVGAFQRFAPQSVRATVRSLRDHSFLLDANRPLDARTTALEAWRAWNPAAGLFHLSTKDIPYTADPARDEAFLRRKARRIPEPPRFKRYPGARRIALPRAASAGEFPRVLLARRTWRKFGSDPISLSDLSTLLGLTWRVQGWHAPRRGLLRRPLKTSPSGGALHPIEAYVLAVRVAGLAKGLYHYAPDTHRLELLRRGATPAQVIRYLPTQTWFKGAAALVLMTAVFPRSQWKYTFARAYRVVLAEAGHLCQTFYLTATWLGLAPFCTMALADTTIEQDLGIDGVTESILYAAGVGTRPG